MTIKWLSLLFVLSAFSYTHAATIAAASCNTSDVQTAINTATEGQTVTIPACSQTNWTSTVTITKGIILQGAGVGNTIIGDNVPKGNASNNCTGGPLFSWSVNAPNSFRMTGMTIVGVATDPDLCEKGHILVNGSTHSLRIDHITINPAQTEGIYIDGDLWGLVDHFTFTGNFITGVRVEHLNWNGTSGDNWGDNSWAAPISYGSYQGIYVEDSSFTGTSTFASAAALDCYSGGRIVFRHNTVNTLDMGSHGADSDQRHRACRWMETYNNTFTYSTINALGFISWIRGGSGVFYNNTITASGYTNTIVQVANCRDASAGCGSGPSYTPWGACNGSGKYDENSTGTGYICVDQPGSGTSCQLGPDSSGTVTVAACSLNNNVAGGWTGNQLEPIYVWNNTLNGSSNNTTAGSTNVIANQSYYSGTARPGYTPAAYPHPLQGGSAPAAPTTLKVTAQ